MRYIASADVQTLGHFPLSLGFAAVQAIAVYDHLPFLLRQAAFHHAVQPPSVFPGIHLIQQIIFITHYIHQRQSIALRSGFDQIRQ